MCGIGGIVRITPPGELHEPIPDEWLDTIDAHIAHRGPDGCGRFRDRVTRDDGSIVEVALVHRRLSIIDHEGGHQPMVSEDGLPRGNGKSEGLIAVVFNGCIYNHRELRAELESRGRVFESDHSDTEVILHWYRSFVDGEYWPEGAGEYRLDGMYSFALWDRDHAALHLCVDDSLKKPMYVRPLDDGRTAAFASTGSALLAIPWQDDPKLKAYRHEFARTHESLAEWIGFGWTESAMPELGLLQCSHLYHDSEPLELVSYLDSFIAQGRPAAIASRVLGALLIPLYLILVVLAFVVVGVVLILILCYAVIHFLTPRWPDRSAPATARGFLGADEVEAMLDAAVLKRLEADVPLGSFLSGGIDSSLVSLLAHRHLGELTTICVRMPDERYDESEYAAAVAKVIGTHHLAIDCQPNPADDLVMLIEQLGLPLGDSSLLPTYWVSKAAREHVKVVLSGDGGDELFCGYERYKAAPHLRWLRLVAWAIPLSRYDRSDPKSREDKMARMIVAARNRGYEDLVSIFPTPDLKKLIGRKAEHSAMGRASNSIAGARNWDMDTYLPHDLLRKVDTASMAVGLEVRCPFMDDDLCLAAANTPIRRLMAHGELKGLLKQVARKHFPNELVDRPKMGFAIPIGEWFRSDFGGMRTLMLDLLRSHEPFGIVHDSLDVNMKFVEQMIEEHTVRQRDHSQRLYMLTVLAIWARWMRTVEKPGP